MRQNDNNKIRFEETGKTNQVEKTLDNKNVENQSNSNNVFAFLPTSSQEQLLEHSQRLEKSSVEQKQNLQTTIEALDTYHPSWKFSVSSINQLNNLIVLTVSITIDGIKREGIGVSKVESEAGLKIAQENGIKDAALKFRKIRNYFAENTDKATESENIKTQKSEDHISFPSNPMAKTLSDLITAKQLRIINNISREFFINANEESMKLMGCHTNELSRKAASSFIKYLENCEKFDESIAIPMLRAS